MQPSSSMMLSCIILAILIALYALRSSIQSKVAEEEAFVSICQVQVRLSESQEFDDRELLSLLAVFKMHDFQIGQPVLAPMNVVLYLCEHRLKGGLKHSIIDQLLKAVIRNGGLSSKYLTWSCA